MPESEAAAEWVPVDRLVPWADNPRKNDDAVRKVARSIKRFGFASPIIARRENGEVIAGHTRLRAAVELGLTEVPVRFLDLDPADAHLLALADNKLGEVAEWDDKAVAAFLSDYGLSDAELAGWDASELDKIADKYLDDVDTTPVELNGSYSIVVTCKDEGEQAELLTRFEADGLTCRALMI